MLRLVTISLGISLSMSMPILAQSTTQETGPQGERLTCSQTMPALALGNRQKPSKEQAETLCSCIWGKLSEPNQKYAETLKTGQADLADTQKVDEFSNIFGTALEDCSP
mgnify:CR=1 FL=1